jgi:beta-lactamase class A
MKKPFVFLILAILLLVISNGLWLVRYRQLDQKLDSTDLSFLEEKYPFIDLSRHFIPQEHFIVNLQPLREELRSLVAPFPEESITIYMEFLNTGANISINNDTKMWPASLAKLPLAMAAMKKVEIGTWKMENELVLMPQDRDPSWGNLYKEPIGTPITIERLLRELLINSDNTAFKMLYRNMTTDELESIIEEVGLKELFDQDGKIGSKDYSRLLRSLYISSYLNRDNSQQVLDYLSQSAYDEYLRKSIPSTIPFAHKIGENQDVQVISDAGIAFAPSRPYLLTVMIDQKAAGLDRDSALALMHAISAATNEYVTNVQKN